MAANTDLTNVAVGTGFTQLLHIGDDDGIEATEHYVVDGNGTASALSLGTTAVGVGTDDPDGILHVEASDMVAYFKATETYSAGASGPKLLGQGKDSGGTERNLGYILFTSQGSNQGEMRFAVRNSDGTVEDKMVIDDSGNVGIGDDSPSRNLVVKNTSDNVLVSLVTGTTDNCQLLFGDTGADTIGKILYNNNGDYMAFNTNGSERLRILSGGGLTFNGDTATANALDDYEEGTWTATVTGQTSGSWNLDTNYDTLAYTKVGRVVHIQGYLSITSESSPSGDLQISLPFNSASLTDNAEYGAINVALRLHGGTLDNITGVIDAGSNTIELIAIAEDGTHNWIDDSDIDSAFSMYIGGSYIAA